MITRVPADLKSLTDFIQRMINGETFFNKDGNEFFFDPDGQCSPFKVCPETLGLRATLNDFPDPADLFADRPWAPTIGKVYEFSDSDQFDASKTVIGEFTNLLSLPEGRQLFQANKNNHYKFCRPVPQNVLNNLGD